MTHLTESRGKCVDAELRGILVEHEVEKEALRLEKVGILRKCELERMWTEDETLFGEDGYSHDTRDPECGDGAIDDPSSGEGRRDWSCREGQAWGDSVTVEWV